MRNPEQVIWDFVQQWLKKAGSDLDCARILLNTDVNDYFMARIDLELVKHSQVIPKRRRKATWVHNLFWTVSREA